MMTFIFKYWRQGFIAILVLALLGGWQLAAQRGRESDALKARIAEMERMIETHKKQNRLLGQARKEDQDRYGFKMEQRKKLEGAKALAVDMSPAVRSIYDSLRDRQTASDGNSR